jgi:hypothetical protein
MKLTLTIESNNATFTDEDEPNDLHVAEAIEEQVVEYIREGIHRGSVKDVNNGQVVGTWELVPGVTE